MAQPKTYGIIPTVPEKHSYNDEKRPDVKVERYFRCTVAAHPDEPNWIFVCDTAHTPLRFHKDVELILPEWAINGLKAAKFTQMVAQFAPFQKSVPYVPKRTVRFMPDVQEEVTYDEYVKWRDSESQKPLPKPGESSTANIY